MRSSASALLFASVLACTVAALPRETLAHGDAGMTFAATTTADGTTRYVDVDYTETSIVARDSIGRFTFNLFTDAERAKPVKYTDLWVRIVQQNDDSVGKTVFAGPIYPTEFGGVGFLFTFPDSGKYTLHVRYNDARRGSYGEALAEAEFPLDVLRSRDENSFNAGSIEFIVGVIAGACAVLIGLLPLIAGRGRA